jgi:dTMP kinase
LRRLKRYLARKGIPCKFTREPGGCPISNAIRKILLAPTHREIAPLTELFLYEAARTQHVEEVIVPALEKGQVVISDRFSDASTAYQGYGRQVDRAWIESLNQIATRKIRPDVTFLLDCPARVGLKRAIQRNQVLKQEKESRFEQEKNPFHARVRKGYLSIARKEPGRFIVVDTREGEEKVFLRIRKVINEVLKVKGFQDGRKP